MPLWYPQSWWLFWLFNISKARKVSSHFHLFFRWAKVWNLFWNSSLWLCYLSNHEHSKMLEYFLVQMFLPFKRANGCFFLAHSRLGDYVLLWWYWCADKIEAQVRWGTYYCWITLWMNTGPSILLLVGGMKESFHHFWALCFCILGRIGTLLQVKHLYNHS